MTRNMKQFFTSELLCILVKLQIDHINPFVCSLITRETGLFVLYHINKTVLNLCHVALCTQGLPACTGVTFPVTSFAVSDWPAADVTFAAVYCE